MINTKFFSEIKKPKILCLGAHPDDIEIGCGGSILRILKERSEIQFYWVIFSGNPTRAKEAHESANMFLSDIKSKKIHIQNHRESYFPFEGTQIKDNFEKIKKDFSPDLIFTHYKNDAHQDHRLISNLTWNTFRNHLILEYEIPKYDGDLGNPNLFIDLDKNDVERKIDFIFKIFKSQSKKQWFDKDTFRSILRIRGIESNSPTKYSEAFYCRKIVIRNSK